MSGIFSPHIITVETCA